MNPYPYRRIVWHNILFFGLTALLGLVGAPLYGFFFGYSLFDWILCLFMGGATMMATTLGYHRLFAHRSFEAHRILVFLNLFFGAGAFEQSVLTWSSQHRDHHRFTDTEKDPYNIRKGFWHAHMGWFLLHDIPVNHENVKDLASDPMIKNQHDCWIFWAIAAGIILPLELGAWFGSSIWAAFFLAVCARLAVIHQSIFLINSACHTFGKYPYDPDLSAADSWVCALLTNGEGYHNFHHRFPNDYRNGVRWYHWDPTKWLIKGLSWMGLTSNLKKTPEIHILKARIEKEYGDFCRWFQSLHPKEKWAAQMPRILKLHEKLTGCLKQWETAFWEFHSKSQKVLNGEAEAAKKRLKQTRDRFFVCFRLWKRSLSPVLR